MRRVIVVLFRFKPTAEAGEDYLAMNQELEQLVTQNPGFIDVKSYKGEDGEELTVAWWKDEKSLREWRELPRHREAQAAGRRSWYQYYTVEVATVDRVCGYGRP